MRPSIGQIVIYHPAENGSDNVPRNGTAHDVPAMIVSVWSSRTCVNLKVFSDGPHDVWVTSVDYGPLGQRTWSWPPIFAPTPADETTV